MIQPQIMIVDDETAILDLLEKTLNIEGYYNIIKISSGITAINTCKSSNPDIIILDIMLPDIDGYEVCKRIREFSHCPILIYCHHKSLYLISSFSSSPILFIS